ncbi:hypothetical protein C7M84_021587 [Penaeus vannamei]|uniref:Chitin-binding type-2 domain-containing protein n=1 Tax=Penaeus vannamei TaxID=6689 RepID=A0A3R7QNQ5_PENVA|nr:hypothetical protein C7M84_021587 [Penaeus vannamei]
MIRNLALILVIQAATAWAQYTCPDAGLFCASCTSLAICTGAGETGNEIDCQTGQLCGVSGPFASCYANTATETSACQCESSGGYLVDPYLPSQYFICLPGGEQLAVTCDATESFDPEQNASLTFLFRADRVIRRVLHSLRRSSSSGAGTVYDCPSGQYFHEVKGVCVPPEDLTPAPFSCGSEDGAFGDTVNCSIFYVCSGGNQIGSPLSCPTDLIFDSALGFCSSGDCEIEVSACATSVSLASTSPASPTTPSSTIKSSTTSTSSTSTSTTTTESSTTSTSSTSTSTTTTPTTTASTSTATTSTTTAYVTPTCSSDGDSFPYPGDCTRFYSCVKGDLEVYTCTGSLVYSPTLGYCTLLANVPECS